MLRESLLQLLTLQFLNYNALFDLSCPSLFSNLNIYLSIFGSIIMSNYKVWHCVHYLKLALLCVLKKKKFLSEMVHLSPAAAKKYMYAICVRMCTMLGIHPLYVQSRPFLTEKLVRPYSDWLDRLLRPWKQWITQIAFCTISWNQVT